MRLGRLSRLKCALFFAFIVSPAVSRASLADNQPVSPAVVNTCGYINRTPLISHVTAPFNSIGSTTIVAYVSTHPSWDGNAVRISGLNDDLGNSWKLLAGPTMWTGSSATLLSAIYYVNAPVTADTHTVTVTLTNRAPLVVHVVAVSGSDITSPPLHSTISSLSMGETSTDVISKPIVVQDHTLLLAWAKNESTATARALDGYTLDRQSTGFLWGSYKPVSSVGSYVSRFSYDTAVGYQTAVVGIRASLIPVASSVAIRTRPQTSVSFALSAFSPARRTLTYNLVGGPTHGVLSGISPNLTYTPEADYIGPDALAFKVYDGIDESNGACVRITVLPKPLIQRVQENSLKISFFSIISLTVALLMARVRVCGMMQPTLK